MSGKVHVSYAWTCTQCDATGDTYMGCEKHAQKAGHAVWWIGRPERQNIRGRG